MILAMNAAAQPIGFPVPMDGFSDAYSGPAIDNEKYQKARGALMGQIRERQKELAAKYKADQEEKMQAMKNLPGANTTGAAAAPATTGSTEGAAKPAAAPAAKAPEKK